MREFTVTLFRANKAYTTWLTGTIGESRKSCSWHCQVLAQSKLKSWCRCYLASTLQAILRLPGLTQVLLGVDIQPEFILEDDKGLKMLAELALLVKHWKQYPGAVTGIGAVVQALGESFAVGQHHCAMEALMEVFMRLGEGLRQLPEASLVPQMLFLFVIADQFDP